MRVRRILVPYDFSANASRALQYAADLARGFDSELLVLFVLDPLRYAGMPEFLAGSVGLGMPIGDERKSAREALAKVAKRFERRGLACRAMIATGSAHDRIVDTARSVEADLIVMATHGRSGLPHLLLGSVAERVVRMAACPVLTVRGRAEKRRGVRRPVKRQRAARLAASRRHQARTTSTEQ